MQMCTHRALDVQPPLWLNQNANRESFSPWLIYPRCLSTRRRQRHMTPCAIVLTFSNTNFCFVLLWIKEMAVYKTGLGQKRTQNLKPDADPLDPAALYKVVHSVQIFMPLSSFFPASFWMPPTAVICIFMCSRCSFRCARLHSHVVPDVKVPGWQRQNTEGHCNYCLCCKRKGFVWLLALDTQPSSTLMAHWVPSYHSVPLSCLWTNPHLLACHSQLQSELTVSGSWDV